MEDSVRKERCSRNGDAHGAADRKEEQKEAESDEKIRADRG